MKYLYYYIILLLLATSSCIDVIDVDLPDGEEKLVVFGNLTNEDSPQFIKVSRTTSFKSNDLYPSVTGAIVYVTDRVNNKVYFEELPDSNDGVYYAPSSFGVVPGDAYILNVLTTDGEHVISTRESAQPVSEVLNMQITAIVDPKLEEVDSESENYYATALIEDQEDVNNYYRWRIFVNGEERKLPADLTLFDDILGDGVVLRFDAGNVLFTQGDSISVKHGSMSASAYKYYQILREQTEHDQLDNSYAKPTILQGNLVNLNNPDQLVLGYFSAQDIRVLVDFEW